MLNAALTIQSDRRTLSAVTHEPRVDLVDRILDQLEPLVANLGHELGLYCFSSVHGELTVEAIEGGGFQCDWVILVSGYHLERVIASGAWKRVQPDPKGPLWTDDFSSLLGVLQLR